MVGVAFAANGNGVCQNVLRQRHTGYAGVADMVDIRTGHSVAVKILKSEYNSDKEFLERFQREAQAASLMSHHNIVNLLDVGVEGEYRYLVLEYVSGSITFSRTLSRGSRLNA